MFLEVFLHFVYAEKKKDEKKGKRKRKKGKRKRGKGKRKEKGKRKKRKKGQKKEKEKFRKNQDKEKLESLESYLIEMAKSWLRMTCLKFGLKSDG